MDVGVVRVVINFFSPCHQSLSGTSRCSRVSLLSLLGKRLVSALLICNMITELMIYIMIPHDSITGLENENTPDEVVPISI